MNNKYIKQLAWDVNNLLNRYLEIDKELKDRSTGFLSIFRTIPFESLKNKLEQILKEIDEKQKEIEKVDLVSLDVPQREFIMTLSDYSVALSRSIKLFYKSVFDLYEASKGSQGKKLTFAEHRENTKAYQDSMNNYYMYGQKLNDLFDQLN